MNLRVNNSLRKDGKQILVPAEELHKFNEDSSRERGEIIVKERELAGQTSDGSVTEESKKNPSQKRASAISKWAQDNTKQKD